MLDLEKIKQLFQNSYTQINTNHSEAYYAFKSFIVFVIFILKKYSGLFLNILQKIKDIKEYMKIKVNVKLTDL